MLTFHGLSASRYRYTLLRWMEVGGMESKTTAMSRRASASRVDLLRRHHARCRSLLADGRRGRNLTSSSNLVLLILINTFPLTASYQAQHETAH